ncbi:MAG: DUF1992 domain-containing protein [Herpetosiphonaceae bacterium]|nr:DUF1992 domain-containing protein [Herpetosiphonaceae bacterium]
MGRAEFLRRQAERLRTALQQSKELVVHPEEELVVEEEAKTGVQNPANLATWQGLVEQRIQDGMAQGLFDNLQGMGRPLNLYDDAFVPDDMRMAFRVLRSNNLAPLWIEVNREIHEDLARLQRMRGTAQQRWPRLPSYQRERLREDYADRIKEINDKIINYNIMAPSSSVNMGLLLKDEELAAFDAATILTQT